MVVCFQCNKSAYDSKLVKLAHVKICHYTKPNLMHRYLAHWQGVLDQKVGDKSSERTRLLTNIPPTYPEEYR